MNIRMPEFNVQAVIFKLISLGLFIIAGSIHEFSHAFLAYLLGDNTAKDNNRLTLNPISHIDLIGTIIFPILASFTSLTIFGWMKPVPVNRGNFLYPSRDHAITAFAGPYSNLLQASLSLIVIKVLVIISGLFRESIIANTILGYSSQILFIYFKINIVLMIFNLLPLPPLDGGWILRHFIGHRFRPVFDRIYRYGFIILYALLLTGFLGFILRPAYYIINISLKGINGHYLTVIIFILSFLAFVLPFFLFFRLKIIGYFSEKISKMEFKNRLNETNKNIDEDKKEKILINKIKKVIKKLENNIELDYSDQEILGEIKSDLKSIRYADNLCDPIDFKPGTDYCDDCSFLKSCYLNKLSDLLEKQGIISQ